MKPTIGFEDFSKLDLRIAEVLEVKDAEGADKLFKITLDVGELGKRVIISGIRPWYKPEDLIGKKVVYLANLEPKIFKDTESQGMLIAAGDEEAVVLVPDKDLQPGEVIR